MKEIRFSPLRRIKKTGKMTVASYMQWRKVKVADYSEFILSLGDFSQLDPNERVHNHKGELLFWYNHESPDSLRMLTIFDIKESMDENGFDSSVVDGEEYKLRSMEDRLHWSVNGFDCDAVPVFSHYTQDYISTHFCNSVKEFEILTVETVLKWYWWFIFNLRNTTLNYK